MYTDVWTEPASSTTTYLSPGGPVRLQLTRPEVASTRPTTRRLQERPSQALLALLPFISL